MYTPNTDSLAFADKFKRHLIEGERILWTGKPGFRLFCGGDIVFVPFTLAFGAGVLHAIPGEKVLLLRLWGLLFAVVAIYVTVGRFFHKAWTRKRTCYAVTDERVLALMQARGSDCLRSMLIKDLPNVERTLESASKGAGTLRFGNSMLHGDYGEYDDSFTLLLAIMRKDDPPPGFSFFSIPTVDEVFRLIIERQQRLVESSPAQSGSMAAPTFRSASEAVLVHSPKFQKELLAGERILWTGKSCAKLFHREDLIITPISLICAGLVLTLIYRALLNVSGKPAHYGTIIEPLSYPMLIAFAGIALYTAVGRFFHMRWKQKRTFYGVTNHRVLELTEAWRAKLSSMFIGTIPFVALESSTTRGTGTVRFGNEYAGSINISKGRNTRDLQGILFDSIADAEQVYRLVLGQPQWRGRN